MEYYWKWLIPLRIGWKQGDYPYRMAELGKMIISVEEVKK